MSKRILFSEAENANPEDFESLGLFPQEATDRLVGDAINYPAHWARFTVSASDNAQNVDISPGSYHDGEIIYVQDGAISLSLQPFLPLVVSDERWVALILRGSVEEISENRFFETSEDPETTLPVSRPTPKVEARQISVVVQQGNATPAPAVKPVIAETDCCIAFVRLTTSGVQEIVPGESWRVKSLYEVEGRVASLEVNVSTLFNLAATLQTDLANANSAIEELRKAMIRPAVFRQVRRDVAAIRRQVNVPEGARSDFYDPGLLIEQWDTTHPLWMARVDYGLQFPFLESREARLELVQEDDAKIMFSGRRMVPAWDKVKRIYNEGGRSAKIISQVGHTVMETKQKSISKTRWEYGPVVNACENAAEWAKYSDALFAGRNFFKDGEVYETIGKVAGQDKGHNIYAVRTRRLVPFDEVYWNYAPENVSIDGSIYGQTFLVAQPMVSPSLEVELSKVGSDGAITAFFCETTETGGPVIGSVIGRSTIEAADLVLGWNEFVMDLTVFEPGKRYAWFLVTNGNHELYGTAENAFSGGSSFRLTDGVWAQADLEFDFNFRVNGCRFRSARTVVEFVPMTLAGGMAQFKLLYPGWELPGTAISWEVQPVFGGEEMPWQTLEPTERGDNPLVGLPPMVRLRATMLTTPDLAPMIELNANATYEAARLRSEFRVPSQVIDFGFSTEDIVTYDVIDDFDPAIHTYKPGIIACDIDDNVVIEPDAVTIEVDPDRPERRYVLAYYTATGGTANARHAPGGETTNPVDNFFVQNVALFGM